MRKRIPCGKEVSYCGNGVATFPTLQEEPLCKERIFELRPLTAVDRFTSLKFAGLEFW